MSKLLGAISEFAQESLLPVIDRLMRGLLKYWVILLLIVLWVGGGGIFLFDLYDEFISKDQASQRLLVLTVVTFYLTAVFTVKVARYMFRPAEVWSTAPLNTMKATLDTGIRKTNIGGLSYSIKPSKKADVHRALLRKKYGDDSFDLIEIVIAKSRDDWDDEKVLSLAEEISVDSPKRPSKDEVKYENAQHEAGHAFVSNYIGHTILDLSIVQGVTSDGHCIWMEKLPRDTREDAEWRVILSALAGKTVDNIQRRQNVGSSVDMHTAISAALRIISLGKNPTDYDGPLTIDGMIGHATTYLNELVSENMELIMKLAEELYKTKNMSGREVLSILEPQT